MRRVDILLLLHVYAFMKKKSLKLLRKIDTYVVLLHREVVFLEMRKCKIFQVKLTINE